MQRFIHFLQRVSFLLATTWSLFGGSYPAGNFTQTFDFPDGTVDLADGSTIGSSAKTSDGTPVAVVTGSGMRLVEKGTTNAIGSFKLPDLDPGSVVRSFDLKFSVTMDAPAGLPPGEGWSVNFGKIPNDNGTGEGGFAPLPRGLTIAFDPFDNGNDPSSIEIFIGGVSITNLARTFAMDQISRAIILHWDSLGLDLTYENKVVFADLPTPGFAPGVGDVFAFTARTTSASMDVFIDTMKATTTPVPVIESGGPVISEFVANNGEFEDEFADKPSWLEIMNGASNVVNLAGWYLTDSKQNLTKWKISTLLLSPYNYQVVFASGKERSLSTTSLPHAPFTLSKTGGYLALVKPDGTNIASSYEYGPQEKNVAFGEKGQDRRRGYMFPATPGAVNTVDPAPESLTPEVQFSHPGSFISEPVLLSLSVSNAPGAEIHYTLDRTEPGLASPIYSNSITVTQFLTVRARAYLTNHLPSIITSHNFVMMDGTLTNYAGSGKVFDSNLPLIFLDSYGVAVDGSTGGTRPFRPTYAVVISPDPKTGRASLTNSPEYAGPAGTHVRGESSAGFDQRSYSLELWDEAGKDTDVGLLGMPADSDWVLYGPWSEKTLMRNKLIFDWMANLRGEVGMSVRTRFVEVFFNQTKPVAGKVSFNSSYKGIFVLMEKLKRGKDRVPLENMNDKTIDPELITGGYIIRKDKDDAAKNNWTSPRFGIAFQSYDPDRLNTPQLNYIKNYISNYEGALNSANFKNFTNGYQAYIDTDTFIDAQWFLEIAKQVDGYGFSTYFHKDRGGRLRAGPLWDFNIALGNADYATGDNPIGWYQDSANGVGQLWWPKLHSDPDYRISHWDRYWQMRRTILVTDTVMATIDRHMKMLLDGYAGGVSNRAPAQIENPIARHFRKWPRLGIRDWPNPAAETKITTWQAEVEYMKTWLKTRLLWLDDQSMKVGKIPYRPPVLSHSGGLITNPVELTITPYRREDPAIVFPDGDIYFTTDGSDPRLFGGEVNAAALKYSGSFTINSSLTVNARLYSQKQWSALATATFFLKAVPATATNLVISEIMFRPANISTGEVAAGLVDTAGFEFLELRNISKNDMDLAGVKVTKGVELDFQFVPIACRLLKSGESVVLVSDKRAFMIRYPNVPVSKIAGQFRGHLDSGGETVALEDSAGVKIKQFRYEDDAPWPSAGSSAGRSLVLRDPATNPNPEEPTKWMLSLKAGGTPAESGLGGDSFEGDPSRDSDNDGLSDLFEFATGSDPENPGSRFTPAGSVAGYMVNGVLGNYLTFTFHRRAGTQGLKLAIEMSNSLKTWEAADSSLILVSSVTNRDGTLTDTYRGTNPLPSSPPRAQFYRLKVQQQ